ADWRSKANGFVTADSYLSMLDEQLGLIEAIDAKRETIPYGGYELAVRRVKATEPDRGRGERSAGDRMLARANGASQLAEQIQAPEKAPPPATPALLGPLPESVGRAELAVTALIDFEQCPMRYRWRYDLRAPANMPSTPRQGGGDEAQSTNYTNYTDKSPRPGAGDEAQAARPQAPGADAATMGTLYHRCMELLDFARPQPAEMLARSVVREMELDESVDVGAVAAELEQMLAGFADHELSGKLRKRRKRVPRAGLRDGRGVGDPAGAD
ncbi:unnamed protein product, partial [marine sediment metagenome]